MALHHLTPKAYDHLSPKKTSEKKHPFPIDQFPSHNRVEKMEILIRGKTCHSGYKQPCKAYLSSCLKPTTATITFNPNKTTHLSKVRNKIPTALHRELEPRKCKTRTVAQAACAVLRGKPKRRKYMMTSPMGGGARDAEGCRMRVTDVCRGVVCVCVCVCLCGEVRLWIFLLLLLLLSDLLRAFFKGVEGGGGESRNVLCGANFGRTDQYQGVCCEEMALLSMTELLFDYA